MALKFTAILTVSAIASGITAESAKDNVVEREGRRELHRYSASGRPKPHGYDSWASSGHGWLPNYQEPHWGDSWGHEGWAPSYHIIKLEGESNEVEVSSGKSGKSSKSSKGSKSSNEDGGSQKVIHIVYPSPNHGQRPHVPTNEYDHDWWDDGYKEEDWIGSGHRPSDDDDYSQTIDGNAYYGDAENHVTDFCYASCEEDVCTYNVKVDLFASEFGFYIFEECEDIGVMPTITMELGKTYKFVQKDISNYIHPIGFAYYADGPYNNLPEIQSDISPPGTDDSCEKDSSCPHPTYYLNNDELDQMSYEQKMAHPIHEWAKYGTFSAEMLFPEGTGYGEDLFYFCHLHQHFGGRIKLLHNGELIQPHSHFPIHMVDIIPPSPYDQRCGTYYLANYQLPHPQCPHQFICNNEEISSQSLSIFADCLESMNCHMFAGMTTHDRHGDVALFIHHMIPHHQNAVNMAKSLLIHSEELCVDLRDDQTDDCILVGILREIISSQNAQIQIMRELLADNNWPITDDCEVKMNGHESPMSHLSAGSNQVNAYADPSSYADSGISQMNSHEGDVSYNGKGSQVEKGYRVLSTYVERTTTDGICSIPCNSDICEINVAVDLFATALGAFTFEDCGGEPYPTIGLEIGKTYRFVQKERSNYYHPLGFAYFADGAHANKTEVEEKYLNYKIDGKHVGLNEYEPKFFHSPGEWTDYGVFNVEITLEMDYGQDLFYFCHIHEFMSGRIKLMKNGVPVLFENVPEMPYMHVYQSSSFDKKCGTIHLGDFQLPHPECPNRFICESATNGFAKCIEAMNCAMMVGMTTYAEDRYDGDVALFNHQMIPHHENAVNMAKALLKVNVLSCPSLSADTNDCRMERILREIVNNQNYQIQQMKALLENDGFPEFNDCIVNIDSNKLRG